MSVVTPGILPRERLLDLIDSPTLAPITLVTAPAGYGKSTLVHQWAARHAPHPCGWYQIRTEHNTLATFLLHLWHAIDDAASPLPPPDPLTIDRVLDRLHACTDQTVLILDDYHLIENGLIHQVTEQLVRNLPPATHLFLLSRQLPDIALARLRAYGQVRQLAQDDLAFTFAEVKQVFAGFPLDDALLAQLTQKSEGWIAGLQLMLMSVNLTTSPAAEQLDRLIATMPENRLLNEYIVEEVLDALPDDLRRFVLDTVVLDVLDPHLCDAVLQLDTSDRFLERLENAIVFVGRPGGVGRPLSYHGLFAECVQRLRLRSGIQPSATELRLRASRWYRSRGQSVEATKYALAAGAWGEASETMSEFLHFDRAQGDVWDTIYWVSKLPTSTMKKDVRLLQSYITAILATGRIDEARTLIESFLHIPGFEPTAIQESWHANQRAFVAYVDGDGDEALYQSYRALSRLPWEDASSRLLAWTGIYRELSDRGERELAREALRQAESDHIRQGGASIYWHFLLAPAIANDAAIRGELARAEALNQQFIRTNPSRMQISSLAFDIKLLSIYVEQNRLDLARDKVDGILTDVDESTRIIL
ncbi:MAG: hypothetical protein KC438_12150, partial [Thermomicrobiales bacterium]|nr:hypothetical protein [Thermomicrobiales bacterium]